MRRYRRHPDLTDEEVDTLNRVESELKLRGYARKTQKSYMGYCRRFLQWKRDYRGERHDEVRSHLEWLLDRGVSRSAFNIAYSALSFLYGEVLKQPASLEGLRRPRGGRQLPEILSQREMLRLLDSLRNPKHRVILALVYAGGLRVGEVVRLKVSDIDSDRMLIRVQQGKGRKDRYTLLPRSILEDLRSYWKAYRQSTWLFPGAREGRHLTERSVQKVFSRAVAAAGNPQAGDRGHPETQLCDAPARRGDRSALHTGAPRTQELQNDGDLHPRAAEGPGADREPTRHAVGPRPVLTG